jgi:endonuclease/exonuclease/phosphatase family metal-dependent hydrolase
MKTIRIRIATYNLENFSIYSNSSHLFDKKIYATRRVLDEIEADVLALQEIDCLESLEVLNQELEKPYEFIHFQKTNSRRQIHLAALSRFPLEGRSFRKKPLKDEQGKKVYEFVNAASDKMRPLNFSRDLLRAELTLPDDKKLLVFCTHLKSNLYYEWMKNNTDRIRNAESFTIARIINKHRESEELPIILMGDFNQTPGQHSIEPLTEDLGFYDPIADERAKEFPPPYSFKNRAFQNRIDYQLLSPEAKNLYVPHSASIYNDYPAEKASDHFPLYLDLDI